jgi:hypothetical protein
VEERIENEKFSSMDAGWPSSSDFGSICGLRQQESGHGRTRAPDRGACAERSTNLGAPTHTFTAGSAASGIYTGPPRTKRRYQGPD